MNIWAHRGCSQNYPENTMLAFEKAAMIPGLTGIELDIQLTKDGHIVVIHDERVDRTTESIGYVRDHTLEELRRLHIHAGDHPSQQIPVIGEVLDLLESRMRAEGFLLNIELKNSVYPYPGMEEQIVDLIHKRGLERYIVYSTFYARSLQILEKLDPEAQLGILDTKVSDCIIKARGLWSTETENRAIHPYINSMDLDVSELKMSGYPVRTWFSGHLYPEKPTGGSLDLDALEANGITDIIINEPEKYFA